jgi:putative endonuclease
MRPEPASGPLVGPWTRWIRRWRARRSRSSDAVGRRGERAAVRLLRREGYRVLARRLRTLGGEVDVLALDGATVVLVEVKTTTSGPGAERRVDARERRRMADAWSALVRRRGLASRPHRLDVVAVRWADGRATCTLHRAFAPLSRAARRVGRPGDGRP